MKKIKIFSLILVALFTCSVFIFSACGNDVGYNMANIKNDMFTSIQNYDNVKTSSGKLAFDYTIYEQNGNQYLQNLISDESSRYNNILKLHTILDNSLDFTYNYAEFCTNNFSSSASERNNIKNKLNSFSSSATQVSLSITDFARNIRLHLNDVENETCLFSFKNLVNSYLSLINNATQLNDAVKEYYFNNVVATENPYNINKQNYNASNLVSLFNSRVRSQIGMLTQNYVEMYLLDADLPAKVANNTQNIDLSVLDYSTNVNNLKIVDVTTAIEKANSESNKDLFYNLAVEMYNIEQTLKNNHSKTEYAYENFNYLVAKTGDRTQKMYAQIIENNNAILNEYNLVLVDILNIIGD